MTNSEWKAVCRVPGHRCQTDCLRDEATPIQKIELHLLLEEMDKAGWTSNAIEYVERAVGTYEQSQAVIKELLRSAKRLSGYATWARMGTNRHIAEAFTELERSIAKAESLTSANGGKL